MLHINDLTFRIEGRVLFDKATVGIPAGHKVGLVGRNGSGKTTLLRLISGELAPDDGAVNIPRSTRIGQVAQEAPGGPDSLIEFVLAADTERSRLLAEAETAHDPGRIADIVRAAQADGTFRDTISPEFAAMAFYGAIEQVLTGWIFGLLDEEDADYERAKRFVVTTICEGLEVHPRG